MTIQIRRASATDAAALHRLNESSLGYDALSLAESLPLLEKILSDPCYALFVAEENGSVIGYVQGSDYTISYMPPLKNILALAVDPPSQGKGVGTALLRQLETWAEEDGARGVRLVSGINRERAHAFYRKNGYKLRKEQKNFIRLFDGPTKE